MQRDAMVQTALTIKKLAVLAAPFRVLPANGSREAARAAEFAQANLEQMEGSVFTLLGNAMEAFASGWSVQECVYREREGRLWLAAVRPKDPSWFGVVTDASGARTALRLHVPGEPERDLPIRKFAVHVHRGSPGRPKGASDLEAAYRHWQSKQALLAAWRLHLERFASPTVLGRFQRGLAPDEVQSMLGALQDLQDRSAILFPSEVEVDTLGGSKESSAGFLDAIEFHNREMARAVLGQTLTTDEGRRVGSLALGKVHLQVLMLQVAALRRELADGLMTEQILRPLTELNFGPGLTPKFVFEEARLDAFVTGKVA